LVVTLFDGTSVVAIVNGVNDAGGWGGGGGQRTVDTVLMEWPLQLQVAPLGGGVRWGGMGGGRGC